MPGIFRCSLRLVILLNNFKEIKWNMDQKAVIKLCKEYGCCNACCLRYIGIKNPNAYEKSQEFILKYLDSSAEPPKDLQANKDNSEDQNNAKEKISGDHIAVNDHETRDNSTRTSEIVSSNGTSSPPAKRMRSELCPSCIGILQEINWTKTFELVKEQLDKKRYDCDSFACALSAPIATMLREKAIALNIKGSIPEYEPNTLTPLKEAWKWSFGVKLESFIGKTLTSGNTAPLLITVVMEYPDDLNELEIVKTLSPTLFASRRQQRKRYAVEMTRRSVEEGLGGVTLEALNNLDWKPAPAVYTPPHCASVICTHVPHYIGGRYIKLSRELSQTPWVLGGKRMMESSVQESIFEPIAELLQMPPEDMECHMKFMSAGREDVDVRCLGEGRPFAIEISDPRRKLTPEELQQACLKISSGGKVIVKQLVYVTKDDLSQLKKGEETKTKTYEAICIKLTHSKEDEKTDGPPRVTERDIAKINTYRNAEDKARVVLKQKTPIRVLHRRPLLTRTRKILSLESQLIPDKPQLFLVRLVTEAGTYIKEWAHGELGRTSPSLGTAIGADTDILALDVVTVDLPWPPAEKCQ